MKFRLQFEFHKIPEWHQEYIDYLRLKLLANNFDQHVKSKIYFLISDLKMETCKSYQVSTH